MSKGPIVAFGLVFSLLLAPMVLAADPAAPASGWVPKDAILAIEVSRPKILLNLALSPKTLSAVVALPAYQKALAQPQWREFQGAVAYLEARLSTTWSAALHKLLDGGVLLSVHPHEGVLLIADAEDRQLLGELHKVLVEIAKGVAAKAGQPERVKSEEYRGATIWTFAENEAHTIIGNRLVLSNRPALLKEALDLQAERAAGLASLPAYQAAKKAADVDAVGTAFVNIQVFKQIPDVQKMLAKDENPMTVLLFAAMIDALRGADWLGLDLKIQENILRLRAAVNAKPSDRLSPTAFAVPHDPGNGVLPNLLVPQFVAGVSLYRDLHGFYAAKDKLFPERTSGLIFFENMMGIFFSGKDLTDEVFAETRPEIRLVVAEQKYDPAVGTPQPQIPAFGAVLRVRHPEQVADMTEEAWQKAIGLVNVTQGQKAQSGLIIDRKTHSDVRMTVAYFSRGNRKGNVQPDIRYNFRPTLARMGEYLLLVSTDQLAENLIDALKKETAAQAPKIRATHSLLEVDGTRLASAIQVNRDALVRNSMVENGKTEEQAQSEFDLLITLIQHLGRATLEIGRGEGRHEARLEVKLALP
jgi:hypothetical protein